MTKLFICLWLSSCPCFKFFIFELLKLELSSIDDLGLQVWFILVGLVSVKDVAIMRSEQIQVIHDLVFSENVICIRFIQDVRNRAFGFVCAVPKI